MMRKSIAFFTAAMLFITLPAAARASESAQADTDVSAQSASPVETEGETEDAPEAVSAPQDFSSQGEEAVQDHIVTTNHTAVIQGKELSYTAQAGTMVLETGGNNCEIFFTAYTLDGVEDPSSLSFNLSFGNAFNNYVVSELGFQTDRPYIPTNDEVNAAWSFPISPWGGYVSQERSMTVSRRIPS